MSIQDNNETLNNIESEKWNDLIKVYATQTTSLLTSSGLSNQYALISYKYSPSTQFWFENSINKAFVCWTNWQNLNVQNMINLILKLNQAQTKLLIQKHRVNALCAFKTEFQWIKCAKKVMFENDNFFRNLNAM